MELLYENVRTSSGMNWSCCRHAHTVDREGLINAALLACYALGGELHLGLTSRLTCKVNQRIAN